MFLKRQYTPEIMDDFSIKDERIDNALNELNVINKYLGGNSASIKGIKKITDRIPKKYLIKILDIGAGGSNLKNVIKSSIDINIMVVNVDINIQACRFGKNRCSELNVVCSDAFQLPFGKESFDIVHVSLFLHHFKDDELKCLLNSFLELSKYGIVINDLQRSVAALAGIKLLTWLFSKSEFVKNDGPLSVRRGFLKPELLILLDELNITGYEITWKWAFRWLVIIYK